MHNPARATTTAATTTLYGSNAAQLVSDCVVNLQVAYLQQNCALFNSLRKNQNKNRKKNKKKNKNNERCQRNTREKRRKKAQNVNVYLKLAICISVSAP